MNSLEVKKNEAYTADELNQHYNINSDPAKQRRITNIKLSGNSIGYIFLENFLNVGARMGSARILFCLQDPIALAHIKLYADKTHAFPIFLKDRAAGLTSKNLFFIGNFYYLKDQNSSELIEAVSWVTRNANNKVSTEITNVIYLQKSL